jgi:hypothetical protein
VVSLDFILADPNFWHLSIHNRTYAVENGKRIFSDRILSAVYNEAARVAGDLGDFMGLGPDET